jgi:hypothetical protein
MAKPEPGEIWRIVAMVQGPIQYHSFHVSVSAAANRHFISLCRGAAGLLHTGAAGDEG